jgi:sporulation protein YlmC with PRC-barrel domain
MRRAIIAAAFAATLPTLAAAADAARPFVQEQQSNEWRMYNYIGQNVFNANGEKVGVVHDVMFEHNGKVTTVVISVGGFLGMGAKLVGVPFQAITYVEKDGVRQITVPLTKDTLKAAPDYALTEKTKLDKARDKAEEAAESAGQKASELKDRAMKKIDEYRK